MEGFSVRSCYKWLRRGSLVTEATARKHKEIWGCHAPLKVKAFMWIMLLNEALTRDRIARWSPQIDRRCAMCGEADETGFTYELWLAGKALRVVGDRRVRAKVTQLYIPATLVESLADAIESGTRDQHSDALVNELTNNFEKCQQLLNSISASISSKAITVEGQKHKLEETEQLGSDV
ncbi:Mediator of RNA polymerase II transcription subunit 9 [Acorus calamus]|uniref:Mediator of RNA polymerase II transcription subunit 9 n=1 Tax=Acorus calamus TaxID=4465 RepID=A0AAV9EJF9_ACOCL|nr:Mediator of RNA polymerase II transcription subunit 9 [Acorus calamus]